MNSSASALLLAEAADSLALAVITSSNAPVLLLDEGLDIIAASGSFGEAFGVDPAQAAGRPLAALGAGEWNVAQLLSLLRATAAGAASIEAYEMDLARPGRPRRRLVVNARKLDYFDAGNVRLVLSVADVTDARVAAKLSQDLLREKGILLQELQHRIANSLQIIASVLMQGARRARSRQARGHLRDAHNRVTSIATLQRQLAASPLEEVELRAYFTELCASIGASMIGAEDRIALDVKVDRSVSRAEGSVSLGLIVTELVINALKHAFPRHLKGRILVDYRSEGEGWTLSVRDTGVGMPAVAGRPGLGTGIIEALAGRLGAVVAIAAADPGTKVSIIHVGSRAAVI
ncbi:MAG TPA: histidine kinase dimerization/phosphoacceptor domain -containing protein [Allosphingosinicella sp.]|nr:histidine kinase dimerization/phosphoacceptor domain -containing protein [Allosphingosinicella sp.]